MLILEAPPSLVVGLSFSADSTLLAAGLATAPDHRAGSGVRVWDAGGSPVHEFDSPEPEFRTLASIRPGCDLVAAVSGHKLMIRPLSTDVPLQFERAFTTHRTPGEATSVEFLTPDLLVVGTGKRAGNAPGGYYLYDLPKKSIRSPVQSEPHGVRAIAVHRASKSIAWATGNNLICWANISKPGHGEFRLGQTASDVDFHPDGTSLAAAVDWKVRTFDLASRSERSAYSGHKGQVTSVAYSPNGRILASGSWDETVRLWEVATGYELAIYQWNVGKILSLAFSPDNSRLAAGSDRGLITLWDLD